VTSVREFVDALGDENAAFWTDRDVRLDAAAAPAVRLEQIRYRMRQGVYNELRSVELIAAWIPHVPEREIRDLLPGQLDDEHRHYQLLRRRLLDLGEDPDAYRPLPEWETLFDWLVACRTRPTLEKLAMFRSPARPSPARASRRSSHWPRMWISRRPRCTEPPSCPTSAATPPSAGAR
jgi:hypothetical protein